MTLVYRAIWTDAAHHAVRVLDDEFAKWCESKGIDPDDLPRRGKLEFGDKTVDIRRGDAEFGQVLRVSLREPAEADRVWITTATAFYRADQGGTYWVDLDCETSADDRIPLAAPRLVRQILTERPRNRPSRNSSVARQVHTRLLSRTRSPPRSRTISPVQS